MKNIKLPVRCRMNFSNDELYNEMKEIELLFNSSIPEKIVMLYSGIAEAGPNKGKRYFSISYKHGRTGSSEPKMRSKVKDAAENLSQLLDNKGYPNTIRDLWELCDIYIVVLD